MKRYLLFAGHHYYPIGGRHDFQQDFDTVAEAIAWIKHEKQSMEEYYGHLDWWHVVDSTDFMVVKTHHDD